MISNCMKKELIVLIVIVASSLGTINAQSILSKIKMGVKAEANYSGFNFSDMPDTKSTMQPGANVGTYIRFDFTENFAIQEDIMFTYASSSITTDGVKDRYQYFGAEVPIYLMGQWKNRIGGRFYGGLGVYFGLGFSAKMKDSDVDLYKKYDGDSAAYLKRLSNGFAAQIGYEFANKIQINASYKIGMNVLDADKKNAKMLPQSISLGIGYSF